MANNEASQRTRRIFAIGTILAHPSKHRPMDTADVVNMMSDGMDQSRAALIVICLLC